MELFAAEDAHDPTIVDNVGQAANNGWTLNQRNKWDDSFKVGHRLPQDAAKRLARRWVSAIMLRQYTIFISAHVLLSAWLEGERLLHWCVNIQYSSLYTFCQAPG